MAIFDLNAFSKDKMPEAEVALLLAFHLLDYRESHGEVDVAIDGAQVRVGKDEIFPIAEFLEASGWEQTEQAGKNPWQGSYQLEGQTLRVHSRAGVGDVVARIGEKRIRAECKKGNLVKKPSNPEYRILREALGQILTVEEIHRNDIMVVAVPMADGFMRLAANWRQRPLMVRLKFRIALVGRDGSVQGLEDVEWL